MANLSILGLYLYDDTIFDDMSLPSALNRDVVIDNLLAECAELECLYTDPDFMKAMIKQWSKKEISVWNHLYETTQYDYNPIWNKDGTVTETISDTRTITGTASGNSSGSSSRSEDLSGTHKVSAFDETTLQNASQDIGDNSVSASDSASTSSQSSNTDTFAHTSTRLEKGNIGVTTTQSMIQEERDIALFNIIDAIIKSFKQRFCLQVY